MPVIDDQTDRETLCWAASAGATGSEAALWAIAASLCRLAAATDRAARNFGPEAAVDAAPRALETLAAAVDNVAVALESKPSINYPPP